MLTSKAGSATAPKRRSKARSLIRGLLWTALAGIVALAIWCLTLFAIIHRFDGIPKNGQPHPADVGIVLGATLWDDKPSPGLQERLDLALELYGQGLFRTFIVSGGLDDNGATITEAEGMRNYLVARGVPEASIVLEPQAKSTYDNLRYSRAIMSANGLSSAIIVTHDYHGSRSADIAKKLKYEDFQVSITHSKVLHMSFHYSREVLAYTKWLMDKPFV